MPSGYIYPGSKNDFFQEFGGLPDKSVGLGNIFIIFIIAIVIVIIVFMVLYLRAKSTVVYSDHKGLVNLDALADANVPTTKCCVPVGSGGATSTEYIYDTVTGVTYGRQIPEDIHVVCSTFPDPTSCIASNTDANGKVIPAITFEALPYYTWEHGLFVACSSTSVCP